MHDNKSVPVDFRCQAAAAKEVFVAGTFNDWKPDAIPLGRQPGGSWEVTIPLSPGRYEFKFIVDGQWCCEPGCEEEARGCSLCVPNEHGTMNRFIDVV